MDPGGLDFDGSDTFLSAREHGDDNDLTEEEDGEYVLWQMQPLGSMTIYVKPAEPVVTHRTARRLVLLLTGTATVTASQDTLDGTTTRPKNQMAMASTEWNTRLTRLPMSNWMQHPKPETT